MGKRQRFEYKNALIGYAGKVARRYATDYAKRYFKKARTTRRTRTRQRMRRYKGRLTKKRIKKKLRSICQFMKQQEAVHIRRQRRCGILTCGVNEAKYLERADGGTKVEVETAMAALRFYDAGTNTLVTNNAAAGVYQRDIKVSIYRKAVLKNNYRVPVYLEVYSCTPKDSTNTGVDSAFGDGIIDQGNPSTLSPLVKFSDSLTLKALWNVKKLVGKTLMPGSTVSAVAVTKMFKYDIAVNDTHPIVYTKGQGGHNFMFRIVGDIGHNNGLADEVSKMRGGVDWDIDVVYKFLYDAGKDLHDISIDDSCPIAFTDLGVTGMLRIPANGVYNKA